MDARDPDVGIDGAGNAIFVWRALRPRHQRDHHADARSRMERSTPGESLSYYGGSASPQVEVNEPGDIAYTWTHSDGTHDRIQGRIDLASAPLDGVKYLSASGQSAYNAQTAIDAAGNAMFAWERWDGSDWRVQSVRLPAGGDPAAVETHSAPARAHPIRGWRSRRAVPPR